MAVPKQKTPKAKSRSRRAQNTKVSLVQVISCDNCGYFVKSHHVCPACGFYRGRMVRRPRYQGT